MTKKIFGQIQSNEELDLLTSQDSEKLNHININNDIDLDEIKSDLETVKNNSGNSNIVATQPVNLDDLKTEIDGKVNIVDIIDNLNSVDKNKPLSAKQGKELKKLIDDLNTLINSNDTNLDTIQEIVDYIKVNRQDLESLNIDAIVGLRALLNDLQSQITDIKDKTDKITVTGNVNLDTISSDVTANKNNIVGIKNKTDNIIVSGSVNLDTVKNKLDKINITQNINLDNLGNNIFIGGRYIAGEDINKNKIRRGINQVDFLDKSISYRKTFNFRDYEAEFNGNELTCNYNIGGKVKLKKLILNSGSYNSNGTLNVKIFNKVNGSYTQIYDQNFNIIRNTVETLNLNLNLESEFYIKYTRVSGEFYLQLQEYSLYGDKVALYSPHIDFDINEDINKVYNYKDGAYYSLGNGSKQSYNLITKQFVNSGSQLLGIKFGFLKDENALQGLYSLTNGNLSYSGGETDKLNCFYGIQGKGIFINLIKQIGR